MPHFAPQILYFSSEFLQTGQRICRDAKRDNSMFFILDVSGTGRSKVRKEAIRSSGGKGAVSSSGWLITSCQAMLQGPHQSICRTGTFLGFWWTGWRTQSKGMRATDLVVLRPGRVLCQKKLWWEAESLPLRHLVVSLSRV